MVFDCATRTHVGHRRKLNEDAVLDGTDRGIWAVADGMGGHDAGEVASAMIVEALANVAAPADPHAQDRAAQAIAALAGVNDALVAMGQSTFEQRTIGSTVVGLVVGGGQYRCFWVGDSRGYRMRGGDIVQLTRDHSLVQDLVDAGMIGPAEAEDHPNANVVTRAVGAADRLEVDTVGGALEDGDVFLLASDGLTKLVRPHELIAQLSASDIERAAEGLLGLALARGAPDNVSLVIVKCE